MVALWEEVGTPGAAATDTRVSIAIELTRASLDAVAGTSAATEVSLAWLTGGRQDLGRDQRDAALGHLR
jgi:hypothetical protein